MFEKTSHWKRELVKVEAVIGGLTGFVLGTPGLHHGQQKEEHFDDWY